MKLSKKPPIHLLDETIGSAFVLTIKLCFPSQIIGADMISFLENSLPFAPYFIYAEGHAASIKDIKEMNGRHKFWQVLHPEPWWCSICEIGVESIMVTNDERHDERGGGCGSSVIPNVKGESR